MQVFGYEVQNKLSTNLFYVAMRYAVKYHPPTYLAPQNEAIAFHGPEEHIQEQFSEFADLPFMSYSLMDSTAYSLRYFKWIFRLQSYTGDLKQGAFSTIAWTCLASIALDIRSLSALPAVVIGCAFGYWLVTTLINRVFGRDLAEQRTFRYRAEACQIAEELILTKLSSVIDLDQVAQTDIDKRVIAPDVPGAFITNWARPFFMGLINFDHEEDW